jgi:hypothetical protein
MIRKEDLDKRIENQQKEYYGSQAKPMFQNGVFTSDNWNGGDGLVRQYFSDFDHGKLNNDTLATEIEFKHRDIEFSGDIIVTHKWFDDQNYVTIVLRGSLYSNNNYIKDIEHIAYFSWYKSRGCTESALYNGELMSEDSYLFLLNALESTGYKFDLT